MYADDYAESFQDAALGFSSLSLGSWSYVAE